MKSQEGQCHDNDIDDSLSPQLLTLSRRTSYVVSAVIETCGIRGVLHLVVGFPATRPASQDASLD